MAETTKPTALGQGAKNGSYRPRQRAFAFDAEMRARAQEARRAKAAARRTSALRRDFIEAGWWLRLASARGLTLPPWGEPATTGAMETWLRKCGMSVPQYFRLSGFNSLGSWIRENPGWPLRAWAGICLEWEARNG